MSFHATKSLPKKDCAAVTELYRKPRRKRHRNRFKNSNIKKKRLKKLLLASKSNYCKSNIFKLNGDRIMSNWYWSNYKKALEWQNKHKIAHWKACALALLEENRYLLEIINDMQAGFDPKISITHQNLCEDIDYTNKYVKQTPIVNVNSFHNFHQNQCNSDDYDDEYENENEDEDEDEDDADAENEENSNENDDIEFEMSEEMMQFFEQSYKHKIQLRKLQEKESLSNAEEEVKKVHNNKVKRVTEMRLLYGEGASMITGMETAVQLSFDKYCNTKCPKYWPNIPFRL